MTTERHEKRGPAAPVSDVSDAAPGVTRIGARIAFDSGPRSRRLLFTLHRTLDDLPQAPGLYVLLARTPGRPQEARPLYFGLAGRGLAQEIPRSEVLQTALRNGMTDFGTLALPGMTPADRDALQKVAQDLGRANHASLNAAAQALRAIDAVQQARSGARRLQGPGSGDPLAAE